MRPRLRKVAFAVIVQHLHLGKAGVRVAVEHVLNVLNTVRAVRVFNA